MVSLKTRMPGTRPGMTRERSTHAPRKSRLPTSTPSCRRMPWAVAAWKYKFGNAEAREELLALDRHGIAAADGNVTSRLSPPSNRAGLSDLDAVDRPRPAAAFNSSNAPFGVGRRAGTSLPVSARSPSPAKSQTELDLLAAAAACPDRAARRAAPRVRYFSPRNAPRPW